MRKKKEGLELGSNFLHRAGNPLPTAWTMGSSHRKFRYLGSYLSWTLLSSIIRGKKNYVHH